MPTAPLPVGCGPESGQDGQHAAFVEEDQALRRDFNGILGVPRLARSHVIGARLLGRSQAALLSCPTHPAQRPAHRPSVHSQASLHCQPVAALRQGQMIDAVGLRWQ
jgi:hypothetical protein